MASDDRQDEVRTRSEQRGGAGLRSSHQETSGVTAAKSERLHVACGSRHWW